jgi:hypothetical protein
LRLYVQQQVVSKQSFKQKKKIGKNKIVCHQMEAFIALWLLLLNVVFCLEATNTTSISNSRIYFLKKCGGAGCPYTASWLLHINLFRKVTWWIDITKMEAASFAV